MELLKLYWDIKQYTNRFSGTTHLTAYKCDGTTPEQMTENITQEINLIYLQVKLWLWGNGLKRRRTG